MDSQELPAENADSEPMGPVITYSNELGASATASGANDMEIDDLLDFSGEDDDIDGFGDSLEAAEAAAVEDAGGQCSQEADTGAAEMVDVPGALYTVSSLKDELPQVSERGGDEEQRLTIEQAVKVQTESRLVEMTRAELATANGRIESMKAEIGRLRERVEWERKSKEKRTRERDEKVERMMQMQNRVEQLRAHNNDLGDEIDRMKSDIVYYRDKYEPDYYDACRKRAKTENVEHSEDGMETADAVESGESEPGRLVPSSERFGPPSEVVKSYSTVAASTPIIPSTNQQHLVNNIPLVSGHNTNGGPTSAPLSARLGPSSADRPVPRKSIDEIPLIVPPPVPSHLSVDERGYPKDIPTWNWMNMLQTQGKYWPIGQRLWTMFVYTNDMEPATRSELQVHIMQHYMVPDWMSDTMSVIGTTSAANADSEKRYDRFSVSAMVAYNPALYASIVQYREQRVRGCPFTDPYFTLDKRLARGAHLFQILLPACNKEEDDAQKKMRFALEQELMELLATPDWFVKLCREWKIVPAPVFAPVPWSSQPGEVQITQRAIVEHLASLGINGTIVDDAYAFAQCWLKAPFDGDDKIEGWTVDIAQEILKLGYGMRVPRGLFNPSKDVLMCHPLLPFFRKWEHAVIFWLSDWFHPDTVSVRRPPGSKIAQLMVEGRRRAANTHPYRISAINPLRKRKRPATTVSIPVPAVMQMMTANPLLLAPTTRPSLVSRLTPADDVVMEV
ncbi:hypothetical protein C8R43DRAFT_1132023 [Mycena crocata]|nr:hypothetical protein C8R43DRAFT_1132023 [Mycena crocata]